MAGAIDREFITELFAAFRPVEVRRMFGGAGLFVEGLMFGLVADSVIYLKADETTTQAFKREGQGPFSYGTKSGRHTIASYWRMPERLYDDPEELARWAAQAFAVAQQKAVRKSSRARKRQKKSTLPRMRHPKKRRAGSR